MLAGPGDLPDSLDAANLLVGQDVDINNDAVFVDLSPSPTGKYAYSPGQDIVVARITTGVNVRIYGNINTFFEGNIGTVFKQRLYFTVTKLENGIKPSEEVELEIKYNNGEIKKVKVLSRIDTKNELEYYKNGGILQYVLRNMI